MLTIRTIFALTVIAACSVAAVGDTFTFDVTSGTWGTAMNCTPNGTPGSADTAIIPNGKTCTIVDANQAAEIIDVQGTLEINARLLIVGKAGGTTTSTIGGTLKMIDDHETRAALLRARNWVTFNGSGLITGRKTTAGGGFEGIISRTDFFEDEERCSVRT